MLTLIKKAPLFFFLNHEAVRVQLPGPVSMTRAEAGRRAIYACLGGKRLPPNSGLFKVRDAIKGIMIHWLHCKGVPTKFMQSLVFSGVNRELM